MDLEIDMECRSCGWVFTQKLVEMPHGRTLKCPFCFSAAIELGEGSLVESGAGSQGFEHPVEAAPTENKFKL